MIRLVARQALATVPVVLVVSFLVFTMVDLVPGDAAVSLAGDNASPEVVEGIRDQLGLSDPFLTRYFRWLGDLLRLDLGTSLTSSSSVGSLILQRAPVTISLTLGAMVISLVVGSIAGILAGRRPGSIVDRLTTFGSFVGASMPNYFVGAIGISIFAIWLGVLDPTGYVPLTESPVEWLKHLILPSAALAAAPAATVANQLRQAVLAERRQTYARTARAKGLAPNAVVYRHILPNAAAPAITVLGVQFVFLLGGTAVVESLFGVPGIGLLLFDSAINRDITVLQGIAMVSTIVVVVVNFLVDWIYLILDPRLRSSS